MKVSLVIAFVLISASNVLCQFADGSSGGERRISILSERANIRETKRGRFKFPDDIEYTIDIQGMGAKHFLAKKVKDANKSPKIMAMGSNTKPLRKRREKREVEYYTNEDGSFACRPYRILGRARCKLMGIIHDRNQSCFIKGEKGYCEDIIEGTMEAYDLPTEEVPTAPYTGNRSGSANQRARRQISDVQSGTSIVQVAFFLDRAFIDRFSRFNPGNLDAAEEDAEMYITMVANEVTYRYQSVKDLNIQYRGGILDLAINPAMIMYPPAGQDFPFLDKDSTYLYRDTLPRFRIYINGNSFATDFDHATLISGLDLYSSSPSLLGSAYVGTVCATNSNRLYRVSFNEDRAWNVAGTVAHEIGHALGAQHDSTRNTCPSSRFVMSATASRPSATNFDTLQTFSRCSGEYFASQLSRFPECLSRRDEVEFRENFCSGPRGLRAESFDYQCQNYFAFGPSYRECYDTEAVPANGCWRTNSIFCYPGTGTTCFALPYLADGSPCRGRNSQRNYYCYLGDCVEEEVLCPNSRTSALPLPTTPSPPPPTTPPPPPPTTPPSQPSATPPPPSTTPPSPSPATSTPPPPSTTSPPPPFTFPPCICINIVSAYLRQLCCRYASCC